MSDKEPIKGKIIIIIIIMQQRKKNMLTLNLRVEGVEMSFLLNHILFSFSLQFGGLKNGESWKKIGESHHFLSSKITPIKYHFRLKSLIFSFFYFPSSLFSFQPNIALGQICAIERILVPSPTSLSFSFEDENMR